MHDDERTLISVQVVRDEGKVTAEIGVDAELARCLEIELLCLDGVVSACLE